MKKTFKILALVLVLILAIGVLVACNDDPAPTPDGGTPGTPDTPATPDTPGTDDGSGNKNQTFTVTFKYVDPNGNPIEDTDGYTEKPHKKIKWGKDAKNTLVDDPQAFEDYVIIGWTGTLGGEVDDSCTKNIKENKTVYSVVREKYNYEVTFLKSDNSVFQTLTMREGSVIDASIERPMEMGKYFKAWQLVEDDSDSSLNCIRENCSFLAVFGTTDGTIGKVAAGSIQLDGKRDDAYNTSGAYLPINVKRQADQEGTNAYDIATPNPATGNTGSRGVPTVDVDTWIVWDGDFIYLCIEVADKSLVGRNELYVKGGVDAYLNDAVELWYTFEQDANLAKNETRVGLDAMGTATYALGRNLGIGGGRSTHYDDIKFAVRTALTHTDPELDDDLSRTGYVGGATFTDKDAQDGKTEPEYLASYIVEFKIPAWTEGVAADIVGIDQKTGRLPGAAEDSNNPDDYKFTTGTQLLPGDFVRFSLQVNDLMISQSEMTGAVGTYFWDCPPTAKVTSDWPQYDPAKHKTMLFATDGAGKITGQADTYGRFSAAGNAQRLVDAYVMFSLNSEAGASTNIWGMTTQGANNEYVFLKKDGTPYVRQ